MNYLSEALKQITVTHPAEEDYLGENGLLYCGKCHTPKQTRLPFKSCFGDRPLPIACRCEQEKAEREEEEKKRRLRDERVEKLKRACFSESAMRSWTFENDNGLCPQMKHARTYADGFEEMEKQNLGYLLWGAVGTGKSYFAGCIANALTEREISVRMTTFAEIMNDLNRSRDTRNEYVAELCRCRLLIIDDFGMERGTEYSLEQIFNVIDSRYRSGKPLIITTNLTLTQMKNPTDAAHARIYDRVLEMCTPICFTGENQRRRNAAEKGRKLRKLIAEREAPSETTR